MRIVFVACPPEQGHRLLRQLVEERLIAESRCFSERRDGLMRGSERRTIQV